MRAGPDPQAYAKKLDSAALPGVKSEQAAQVTQAAQTTQTSQRGKTARRSRVATAGRKPSAPLQPTGIPVVSPAYRPEVEAMPAFTVAPFVPLSQSPPPLQAPATQPLQPLPTAMASVPSLYLPTDGSHGNASFSYLPQAMPPFSFASGDAASLPGFAPMSQEGVGAVPFSSMPVEGSGAMPFSSMPVENSGAVPYSSMPVEGGGAMPLPVYSQSVSWMKPESMTRGLSGGFGFARTPSQSDGMPVCARKRGDV